MDSCQFINQTGSDLEVSENHFHHNSPKLYDVFLCTMSLLSDILIGGDGRESYQKKTGLPSGPQ